MSVSGFDSSRFDSEDVPARVAPRHPPLPDEKPFLSTKTKVGFVFAFVLDAVLITLVVMAARGVPNLNLVALSVSLGVIVTLQTIGIGCFIKDYLKMRADEQARRVLEDARGAIRDAGSADSSSEVPGDDTSGDD
jgi:hypothetical protein